MRTARPSSSVAPPFFKTEPAVAGTTPAASVEPSSDAVVRPSNSASAPTPSAALPATPARQPALELPSSQAGYLNNPLPLYPKASERLREQGRSVVRVFINTAGVPQSSELVESSGFARLDRAAQATAMAWRYVPGQRSGVPEAMSVDVPIVWKLPD